MKKIGSSYLYMGRGYREGNTGGSPVAKFVLIENKKAELSPLTRYSVTMFTKDHVLILRGHILAEDFIGDLVKEGPKPLRKLIL